MDDRYLNWLAKTVDLQEKASRAYMAASILRGMDDGFFDRWAKLRQAGRRAFAPLSDEQVEMRDHPEKDLPDELMEFIETAKGWARENGKRVWLYQDEKGVFFTDVWRSDEWIAECWPGGRSSVQPWYLQKVKGRSMDGEGEGV